MDILSVPLSELAEIGQVVSGVGAILVVVSIFLVWKQVRQQTQDSRVELTTGLTDLIGSVSRIFIEYPEMRKYFYGNETLGTTENEEHERARAAAVMMADVMDHVTAHLGLMDKPAQDAWLAYCKSIYSQSPVLKGHLEAHANWYRHDLQKAVKK